MLCLAQMISPFGDDLVNNTPADFGTTCFFSVFFSWRIISESAQMTNGFCSAGVTCTNSYTLSLSLVGRNIVEMGGFLHVQDGGLALRLIGHIAPKFASTR